jgi:hypothetical protein
MLVSSGAVMEIAEWQTAAVVLLLLACLVGLAGWLWQLMHGHLLAACACR